MGRDARDAPPTTRTVSALCQESGTPPAVDLNEGQCDSVGHLLTEKRGWHRIVNGQYARRHSAH